MSASSWSHRRVGDFDIEERIGRGASATVYRAKEVAVNRYVAIKIIDLDLEGNANAFRRFEQEAQVVASLEHLHILPIYAYGVLQDQKSAYFVTRLMNGSLNDMIRDGAMSFEKAVKIFLQIANALAYAHSKGVIHRDMKPSNILLDDAGNAYLSDFGLAQRENSIALFDDNEIGIVGTPSYIAPEILLGKPADQRSDIYSFGVVLYHMLTGRVPFEVTTSLNIASLFYKHVQQPPPSPREFNPSIPPAVEKIILRALAKDPHERYLTVNEMMADFQDALKIPVLKTIRPRKPGLEASTLLFIFILVLLMAIITFSAARLQQQVQFTDRNILRGLQGRLYEVTPTEDEIQQARAALGNDGYIAYLTCDLQNLSQSNRAREVSAIADELNLPLRVIDGQQDAYEQMLQVERTRIDGARAMIICPLNPELFSTMETSLVEHPIPLVYSTLMAPDYGVKLDLSNYDVGQQISRYAGQLLQTEANGLGSIVLLNAEGFVASEERLRGIYDGLEATVPNANVIGEWEGYTRHTAYESIRALIETGIEFDVILSISDDATLGAVQALEEAGLTPDDVFIVSVGAEPSIMNYVRQGRFVRGTLNVNSQEGSHLMVYAIVKLLAGSTVPEILTYTPGSLFTGDEITNRDTAQISAENTANP